MLRWRGKLLEAEGDVDTARFGEARRGVGEVGVEVFERLVCVFWFEMAVDGGRIRRLWIEIIFGGDCLKHVEEYQVFVRS